MLLKADQHIAIIELIHINSNFRHRSNYFRKLLQQLYVKPVSVLCEGFCLNYKRQVPWWTMLAIVGYIRRLLGFISIGETLKMQGVCRCHLARIISRSFRGLFRIITQRSTSIDGWLLLLGLWEVVLVYSTLVCQCV